jgi:hypothetical protein
LSFVGHLNGDPIDSFLTQDQLVATINQNFIGCEMDIPSVGGHAVLIVSTTKDPSGSLFVHVADPSDASVLTIPYQQLRDNFRGLNGKWIRSYIVKP